MEKRILGEKHPSILLSLMNLANSYSVLGDYNKALELQNSVYTEIKGNLGENHPFTLIALGNLANIFSNLRDYNKALEMINTVYKTRKEIFGESHPDTLTVLSTLISIQIYQDETDNESIKKHMTAYFD